MPISDWSFKKIDLAVCFRILNVLIACQLFDRFSSLRLNLIKSFKNGQRPALQLPKAKSKTLT